MSDATIFLRRWQVQRWFAARTQCGQPPAAELLELLRERGAQLSYSDPHVPSFPKMREHQFDLKSIPLTPENLSKQDCVVLVTDHDAFDYEAIARHSKLLIDTRGRYLTPAPHIIKA